MQRDSKSRPSRFFSLVASMSNNFNSNIKGSGQECPLHIFLFWWVGEDLFAFSGG
jgi:hypothetical protein